MHWLEALIRDSIDPQLYALYRLRRWHKWREEHPRKTKAWKKPASVAPPEPPLTCGCPFTIEMVRLRGEFCGEHCLTVCTEAWARLVYEACSFRWSVPVTSESFDALNPLIYETSAGQVQIRLDTKKHAPGLVKI